MTRIRVGGVPEHFNEVWQMALEEKRFDAAGLQVDWLDVKEGTGAMIDKLKANELDVIVALTEGLVNEIARGSSTIRLIGTYVQSPLLWAISVKNDSPVHSIDELKGKRFGVSRLQSGSHLMSCVLANQFGWKDDELHFVVEHQFGQLREALVTGRIDAFLWEYFMQKPFYDRAEYRHLGNLLTPWPCFLLASTVPFVGAHLASLRRLFAVLHEQCRRFHRNEHDASVQRIAARFALAPADARTWFDAVDIVADRVVAKATIETAVDALKNAGLLAAPALAFEPNSFVDERLARLVVDIKSMRLYNKPELLIALRNQLRAHRLTHGRLHFTDLVPFDPHHYFATDALDVAARQLGLRDGPSPPCWSIHLGSALGGCARYLAGKYAARLLAVELQNDLSQFAEELTRRCQLEHLVRHLTGNFLHLAEHLQENFYASIMSWLTILHFDEQERTDLFRQSFRLVRPAGHFFLEDFIRVGPLTDEERRILHDDVFCHYLPTGDEYLLQLRRAGFDIVATEELTSSWKQFTRRRADHFQQSRDELVAIHGEDLFSRLAFFYRSIEQLFRHDHVGGIRILARKPPLVPAP